MALVRTPDVRHGKSYSALADVGSGMVIETGTVAFDSSYPTGGEAVTFSIPVASIRSVYFEPYGGRLYTYERATEKIKAWFTRGGTASGVFAEVSNTSDLSAMSNVPYVMFGFARA
jgi:hypothetical protein